MVRILVLLPAGHWMITQGKMKTQSQAWHVLVLTACGFLSPKGCFQGPGKKKELQHQQI